MPQLVSCGGGQRVTDDPKMKMKIMVPLRPTDGEWQEPAERR